MRLKRVLSCALLALAAAFGLSAAAHAGAVTVDFEDRVIAQDSYQTAANSFTEQGLTFSGMQFYFVPAGNPGVSFPTGYSSTFMETAIEPVTIALAGGGAFDFTSIDLGLGAFNTGGVDSLLVTGTKANCSSGCTVTATLDVGQGFTTFGADALAGFTGLSQIAFGTQQTTSRGFPPQADSGYLAFDNISVSPVSAGGVPEPGAWALMILGFGAAGAALRRRRAAIASA